MVSQKEYTELVNDLKILRHQCGEKEWDNMFVNNPEFKQEIENLIKYYKEKPDTYKGEILYYLGILHLVEPKATHPELYDPEKINI